MYFITVLSFAIWLVELVDRCNSDGHIINPIRFPIGGPFMGIFVAVALPLELDNYNVFVAFNFEANYVVPSSDPSEKEYDYPPIVPPNIARKFVYDLFESKLTMYGFSGKQCLLRTICEASEFSLSHTGVLADIVHIILTPSSSKPDDGLSDYESAEQYGRAKKQCKRYKKKCPISVLNLITKVERIFSQ